MRLSAALSDATVPVEPGGEAHVPVTVHNAGDTVEAYQIDVAGIPGEWVTLEPATITLYPATTGIVTVTVRPPRSAAVPAGDLPFGVRVIPTEHSDAAVIEEGVLVLGRFREVDTHLRPVTRTGRIGARYRVDIDNLGNAGEHLLVSAEDSTKQLVISPATTDVLVANDTRLRTRLRVRARRVLWWGEPRELPFLTQVQHDDGAVTTLDGRFIQRPVVTAGLLRLLAALLALVLALLALWFLLLRPAVRGAAREAADHVASDRIAAERRAQQSATPPPQQQPPVTAPSTPADRGGGTGGAAGDQFSSAITFRTNPNATAARSWSVPDGKVFLLTDFLVDNVQGDEGTMVVTANGVRVVTLALENFRNQDYHSVTPIRVPQQAKVTLTVTCRRPGTPANAKQATTCSESLYLNGIMNDLPAAP